MNNEYKYTYNKSLEIFNDLKALIININELKMLLEDNLKIDKKIFDENNFIKYKNNIAVDFKNSIIEVRGYSRSKM